MAVANRHDRAVLELEVAGLEEFLRLLEIEVKDQPQKGKGLPRQVICIAAMCDRQPMAVGAMRVKRYVRAGFVSGDELVTFELLSSDGYEHPALQEMRKLEEKHQRLCEHTRGVIQDPLADFGVASPCRLVNGCLRVAPVQR